MTNILLRSFDFELAAPHAGGYTSTLVLPLSPGLLVRLTPRGPTAAAEGAGAASK